MIADGPLPLVTCDAEGCNAKGDCSVVRHPRDENIIKGFLPQGWGTVRSLGEQLHFCPHHAERLL